MITLLATLFAGSALAAEPIFVPSFEYGSPSDFQVAVMVEGMVTDRLLQDGHIVLGSDVVAPVVGAEAIARCSQRPECPLSVLPQLPTKVAVVTRLDRVGGNLIGHVELFEQSTNRPFDVRDVPIVPGNEHLFANEVSDATARLLSQVGPSPEPVLLAAARLIAGQAPIAPMPVAPMPVAPVAPQPIPIQPAPVQPLPVQPMAPMQPQPMPPAPTGPAMWPQPPGQVPVQPAPGFQPPPQQPPASFQPKRYTGETPHEGPLEPILEGTGVERRHLVGLEGHFRKSGLDPRDWLYSSMSHAGRLTVEIRAGIGMGDVDRWGALRSTAGTATPIQQYWESPSPARRSRGSVYVGYAPAAFIDIGVLAGLQWGERKTNIGVVPINEQGDQVGDVVATDDSPSAVQLLIQPRLRGYLVPMGPVKPFLMTGAEFKVFNRYLVETGDVIYPEPPGGMVPGWVGGGGLLIDPGPIVGIFAEGSYVAHFGQRAGVVELNPGWVYSEAAPPPYAGYTVAVVGGVQFRL